MKYIVLPVCRLIYVLCCYITYIPLTLILFILIALWNFNFKHVKDMVPERFWEQDDLELCLMEPGDKYYYYKTGWDYLIKQKSWDTISQLKKNEKDEKIEKEGH